MKKVVDLLKRMSFKWKLTFLLFFVSIFFFIVTYVLKFVDIYLGMIFITSTIWVVYDLITLFDVFILSIPYVSETFSLILWLITFLIYCFIFAYFCEFLFKKFNFKNNFKNLILTFLLFVILNFILFKFFAFLDLYFNGAGYLLFD